MFGAANEVEKEKILLRAIVAFAQRLFIFPEINSHYLTHTFSMSEAKKTLTFCGIAVIVAGLATFVAWPSATKPTNEPAGKMLFADFKDPLAASSMKIITFDEEQGTLGTFEVRKDRETGLWTIPSRDGYPADAIEQMKVAANSLVDVKILDVQTTNAEDHDDLGVVEPKMETLEVGDEGVGRLVTFKNEKQETLASMIIGDPVKEDDTKRYVRIPNQDPVYVVKFDNASLTTNFTDWIEDDLLQLSSIDIDQVEIKDYSASLGQRGISLNRRYTAVVDQDNNDWTLARLSEYDEKDPRKEAIDRELSGDEPLNKTKLNEMKNALDDLKIVGVFRKPEGVSETLKASKDLLSDQEAITSLAQRGFYPIDVGPDGTAEILSANGELSVSLDSGVKYLLRFGNIAGVSGGVDDQEDGEDSESGVNRYLFVTTMVDQGKFPAPELQPVPQTLEELDALMNPPAEEDAETAAADTLDTEESAADETPTDEMAEEETTDEAPAEEAEEPTVESEMTTDEPSESANADEASSQEPTKDVPEGETEASGEGEATGSGQAQTGESDEEDEEDEDAEAAQESTEEDLSAADPAMEEETESEAEMTDEEREELLEATQEKITKSNQRMLDARKDQLAEAEKKVRDLNARFADWYYVIPETTYTQLSISQEDLLKVETETPAPAGNPMQGGPQLQMPGFPGGGN